MPSDSPDDKGTKRSILTITIYKHPHIEEIEGTFGTQAVGSFTQNCNSTSVGQPGFWEGLIPIWGSGRAAIDDFQNGRWGWGLVNTAFAITDVFLVKALATGAIKIGIKALAKDEAETIIRKETEEGAEKSLKPIIDEGKQGKHIPGHNNFQPGKSEFTHPDPQGLLDEFSGKGVAHGNKEVVDFGQEIGTHVNQTGERTPTTRGTIHYDSKGGAHIVPAKPFP
jgi:hypothetical protein